VYQNKRETCRPGKKEIVINIIRINQRRESWVFNKVIQRRPYKENALRQYFNCEENEQRKKRPQILNKSKPNHSEKHCAQVQYYIRDYYECVFKVAVAFEEIVHA